MLGFKWIVVLGPCVLWPHLLGAKVGGFALLFFLGIGIGARSFYLAGDALYTLLDSGKGWLKVLGWSGLGYLGAGLSACVVIYCVSAAQ